MFFSAILMLLFYSKKFPAYEQQQLFQDVYFAFPHLFFPNARNIIDFPAFNDSLTMYLPFPERDVHFELVTGMVYTAPDDMLDSRPGTLMLTDCIELCRRNATCKAANFETGLCVLFGSSAEEYPGE